LENTEENCEMIGKIWKKPKLKSEQFGTQYILEQWEFFEININHRRILKLHYVGNIIE
jgi:hypothetical protein